jgi:hypothetical protein
MQEWYLYILGYLVSILGNSASIFITMLELSGYSNEYWATIAIACNSENSL